MEQECVRFQLDFLKRIIDSFHWEDNKSTNLSVEVILFERCCATDVEIEGNKFVVCFLPRKGELVFISREAKLTEQIAIKCLDVAIAIVENGRAMF